MRLTEEEMEKAEDVILRIFDTCGICGTEIEEAAIHYLAKELRGQVEQRVIPKIAEVEIPKGWFVYEAGQSAAHMLWFVNMLNFDDMTEGVEKPRQIFIEEKDTFYEALKIAIERASDFSV